MLNTFHHSVINSLDFDSLTLISEQIAKPEQIVTGGSSNSLMITLKLLFFLFLIISQLKIALGNTML